MSDPSNGRTVLVTGATGKQGGATARHLLRRGFHVRALTRSPDRPAADALREDGAEVVQGDLDDRASVDRALDGAYGVFSVQNFWETGYQREVDQGIRLIEAGQEAGVQHFVYSSVGSAHRDTGLSHFESKWEIEQYLRASGLPHTIFRPVWFMENWEGFRSWILGGTLALPLDEDVNFQQITVEDIGGFVGLALENREHWLGRAVDLAGSEGTVSEVVDTFGRVIGRPVTYHQVPWDEYRETAGDEYHEMFRWFQDVGYDVDIPALAREKPDMTGFEEYLRANDWEDAQPE